MQQLFKEINPGDLNKSQVEMWDRDWFLITAGDVKKHNMMTASWGGMGYLWNKPVVFIFIRPSRHTYKFTEQHDYFTLSAYSEQYREQLKLCGSRSGRDLDKTAETGLTPFASPAGSTYFEQASLQIECRKIYSQDLDNSRFLLPEIEQCYPDKQYHRLYIGEMTQVLTKK